MSRRWLALPMLLVAGCSSAAGGHGTSGLPSPTVAAISCELAAPPGLVVYDATSLLPPAGAPTGTATESGVPAALPGATGPVSLAVVTRGRPHACVLFALGTGRNAVARADYGVPLRAGQGFLADGRLIVLAKLTPVAGQPRVQAVFAALPAAALNGLPVVTG